MTDLESLSSATRRDEIGKQRNTAALTAVNRTILRYARDSDEPLQEWEFFCECGDENCYEHVVLTLEAYVALRDADRAVLADGHVLSAVERARRLREDAVALRRQAEHQTKRAKKNLSPPDA